LEETGSELQVNLAHQLAFYVCGVDRLARAKVSEGGSGFVRFRVIRLKVVCAWNFPALSFTFILKRVQGVRKTQA
jgi:hypothetical protein